MYQLSQPTQAVRPSRSWTSRSKASHTAGFGATEIGLLTELYWGLPMRSYSRTRAWSPAEFDAAEARLSERGLVADGQLTPAGREAREAVEVATDAQQRPVLRALGDDGFEELAAILAPWGVALREARAYPASGPHDLAAARS